MAGLAVPIPKWVQNHTTQELDLAKYRQLEREKRIDKPSGFSLKAGPLVLEPKWGQVHTLRVLSSAVCDVIDFGVTSLSGLSMGSCALCCCARYF